jgi:hypothetical protein
MRWFNRKTRDGDEVGLKSNGPVLIAKALRGMSITVNEYAESKPLIREGLDTLMACETREERIAKYHEWTASIGKWEGELKEEVWLAGARMFERSSRRFPFENTDAPGRSTPLNSEASPSKLSPTPDTETTSSESVDTTPKPDTQRSLDQTAS